MNNWKIIRAYFTQDVWDIELASLGRLQRFLVSGLRSLLLMIKGCRDDNLPLHAASLTFSTMMALVPLLALSVSVLKGLGYGTVLTDWLATSVTDMPQQIQAFVTEIVHIVNSTNYAKLGGVGAVVLLVTVIQVVGSIESSFNRVWGIHKTRPLLRKITNYISVLVVVPLLMVAAMTFSARINIDKSFLEQLGILRLTPVLATWIAFTFLYLFIPNTSVNKRAAAISGLAGALMWHMWFKLYITVQPGVTNINVIYGTLAFVPITLFWLYICWLIILVGAEVAFAVQTESAYHLEAHSDEASQQTRLAMTVSLLLAAWRAQQETASFLNIDEYARRKHVPLRLVNDMVDLLADHHILVEVADQPRSYVLVKSGEQIVMADVIQAVYEAGTPPEKLGLRSLDQAVSDLLDRLDKAREDTLSSITLQQLAKKRD